MTVYDVVLDSNVLVAGLRSSRGASFRLLSILGERADVRVHLSVPLLLEYEDAAKRQAEDLGLTHQDIDDVLDYLCATATLHEIFYLWRPILRDSKDDMVLEIAVSASCPWIISYNKRDFTGIDRFGIRVETAREFLFRIGDLP